MRFNSEEEYQEFLATRKAKVSFSPMAGVDPYNFPSLDAIGKKHGLERKKPGHGKPNKTEQEYATRLGFEFPGCAIEFEAITLRLVNGHKYTADWLVKLPQGECLLVEVKNGRYKHASYGRSKMAFDQCRIDYPMFSYRWASKGKDGWDVKNF